MADRPNDVLYLNSSKIDAAKAKATTHLTKIAESFEVIVKEYQNMLNAGGLDGDYKTQTEKAIKAISGKFNNADFLIWIADMLADRSR